MSLHDDPFVIDVKAMIGSEINRLKDQLIGGSASSIEQYKRMVGKAEGLKVAVQIIDDVIANRTNDDEE